MPPPELMLEQKLISKYDEKMVPELQRRVDIYIFKTFGDAKAKIIFQKYSTEREMFNFLLNNLINKQFKYPDQVSVPYLYF